MAHHSNGNALAFSFVLPPKAKTPSGYSLLKAAGSMFGSDKLPELWISVSAPSLRENSSHQLKSGGKLPVHFHEVWRAGKVVPRLNEETAKAIPGQNGKPCGVATWTFPFWMPQPSAPYYLVAIHSGTAPPPSYTQQLASLPSLNDANISNGVPEMNEVTEISPAVTSAVTSMQNVVAYTLLSSAHMNALKDGQCSLPLVLGCMYGKSKSYEPGASVMVYPISNESLNRSQVIMGPLSAPPNMYHPLHHTYVYLKEPTSADDILPPAPPCLLEFDSNKKASSGGGASSSDNNAHYRTTKPEVVVATESSFEVAPCFLLPVLMLKPMIEALEKVNQGWTNKRELEAMSQGCLTDEDIAPSFVALRVTINRGKNLKALPSTFFTQQDENYEVDITEAAPTTFVDVIYDCPATRIHAKVLGRTNTEYLSQEPIYGCNAHSHYCKHSKPDMKFKTIAACVELESSEDISKDLVTFYDKALANSSSEDMKGSAVKYSENKGRDPQFQGVMPVPQPSTFVIQIPKHEIEMATLHFRVVEERVVKIRGKRENAFGVAGTLSVKVQTALKFSENPISEDDACACWYPVESHSGGQSEMLVAVALTEPLIDELDEDDDNVSISFDNTASTGVGGGGSSSLSSNNGEQISASAEEVAAAVDDDEDDEGGNEVDEEVQNVLKTISTPTNSTTFTRSNSSLSNCSGCDANLKLLGIEPSPLLTFINKDCEKYGIMLTTNQNYSKSLLSPTPLTDLSASASSSSNGGAVDLLSSDEFPDEKSSNEREKSRKIKFFTPTQLFPLEINLRSCDKHLANMKKQYNTLNRSMQMIESLHERGRAFRGSKLKTSLELQSVATNLHVQLFKVEEYGKDGLPKPPANRRVAEYDYITHGAPTVHALGYERGGLVRLKAELEETRQQLTDALKRYVHLRDQHLAELPTKIALQEENASNLTTAILPDSEASILLNTIGKLSMRFEGRASSLAVRTLLALSQGLSIAVSSLASKIMILAFGEGDFLGTMAPRWVEHGYLVYFEGLISTQGKEFGMIQDTDAVVAIMRSWRVKLDLTQDGKELDMGVDFEAKTVVLKLSPQVFAKLPPCLQGGATIPLFPILFTQGVDIKQSLANRGGSKAGSGPQYQMSLNKNSFKLFNAYAHRCYGKQLDLKDPINFEIHPLCEALAAAIRHESPTKKNVEILEEAARATYTLGGGITVFCKSGKDRTAMAVTLHQSKALGEYHGCGTSAERVFTDATLMRGYGTRIDVANKNTGAYKYSFNALQVSYLPTEWKPPSFTVQGFVTSVIKRDS